MGLFDWLFRQPKFHRFEDSFAMERTSLWKRLRSSIVQQQQEGRVVWIVTHFADTFSELQELLEEWGVGYQIVDQPLQPTTAVEATRQMSDAVLLILSDLLELTDSVDRMLDDSVSIAMIVVERHPLIVNDRRVEAFARSLPCPVRFGYFLAIDDVVVRRAINDTTIEILKQLGMQDHELITSNMVTRRLEKVLVREAEQFATDQRADSAKQWYAMNEK